VPPRVDSCDGCDGCAAGWWPRSVAHVPPSAVPTVFRQTALSPLKVNAWGISTRQAASWPAMAGHTPARRRPQRAVRQWGNLP
jgi:hypothetical protein